jgi:hypothetical protein
MTLELAADAERFFEDEDVLEEPVEGSVDVAGRIVIAGAEHVDRAIEDLGVIVATSRSPAKASTRCCVHCGIGQCRRVDSRRARVS